MESSEIPPLPTSEPPDEPLLNRRPLEPIIKAKPLTIKKQPPSELPRLRNFGQKEDTMEEKRYYYHLNSISSFSIVYSIN
jgi:hypothetical protein